MATYKIYQNKTFDPNIEMGAMIAPLLVISYRTNCGGNEALGQLMIDIEAACEAQDGEKVLTFPIVEGVCTRPKGIAVL